MGLQQKVINPAAKTPKMRSIKTLWNKRTLLLAEFWCIQKELYYESILGRVFEAALRRAIPG